MQYRTTDLGFRRIRRIGLWAVLGCVVGGTLRAEEAADHDGLSTAVALNYCRASFHQIRKYPAKAVLFQERGQILNNLNLNGIADEEVIRLYGAVLDEIADVQIADQERLVLKDKHQRIVRRQLIENAYVLGTHVVSANYIAAVRAGANSWWDYRTAAWNRDLEVWQVDKTRMLTLVDKSTHFLDTFWKLARKRSIPDEWLVRNQDLDALEEAMREPNLEVRLRVLKRMERFMQAYPPYWYYVGRTEQALGQLFAAAQTYEKLEALGAGHFRRDEMLAAAAANRAVIQDFLRQRQAADSAQEALGFSTSVWEVNLLCARVLARHERFAEAEDAVLRNLDLGLERSQSLEVLLSIYYRSNDVANVARRLSDASVVRSVPIPLLLQCATILPNGNLPIPLLKRLGSSLQGHFDVRFGSDDLVLQAENAWQLERANLSVAIEDNSFKRHQRVKRRGHVEVRLRQVAERGHPLASSAESGPIVVTLQYAHVPAVRLHLYQHSEGSLALADALELVTAPRGSIRLAAVDVGHKRIALAASRLEELSLPATLMPPGDTDLPSLLGVIQETPESQGDSQHSTDKQTEFDDQRLSPEEPPGLITPEALPIPPAPTN